MKTLFSVVIVALVCIASTDAVSQTLFRSRASGSWTVPGTWDFSTNGGGTWQVSTSSYPTLVAGAVTIQSSHTVSIPPDSTIIIDQFTVGSSAVLTLGNNSFLKIRNGTGDDMVIGSGSSVTGSGTVVIDADGVQLEMQGSTSHVSSQMRISGNTTVLNPSSPYIYEIRGALTVDTLKSLTVSGGAYSIRARGNVVNRGTISGGNSDSRFRLRGPSFTNTGVVNIYNFDVDTVSTITGPGDWNSPNLLVSNGGAIRLGGNISLKTAKCEVASGGVINPNGFTLLMDGTLSARTLLINGGGSSASSGFINSVGSVTFDLRNNSNCNTRIKVIGGGLSVKNTDAPYNAIFYNEISIDPGAVLQVDPGAYTAIARSNVINNGTLSGGNSSSSFRARGPSFVNTGVVSVYNFYIDTVCTVSGSGDWTSAEFKVPSGGELKLGSNVTMKTPGLEVLTGGAINPNGYILVFDGTLSTRNITIFGGASTRNSGFIHSIGSTIFDLRNSSNFDTKLKIVGGTANIRNLNGPFTAYFYNELTIDPGAVLRVEAGGYTVFALSNVINNGTITGGNSGSDFRANGGAIVNNGLIDVYNFGFSSSTSMSGTGIYASTLKSIYSPGIVTLASNINFGSTGSRTFRIYGGAKLNLNGYTLNLNGTSGNVTFQVYANATSEGAGLVNARGSVNLDIYTSSNFLTALKISTGTATIASPSSPFVSELRNTLTIDTGATLRIEAGGYTLYSYDSLFNKGTITTGNSGGDLRVQSTYFRNDGVVSAYNVEFESPQASLNQYKYLTGTGSFTTINLSVLEGTYLQLLSGHTFNFVNVNSGATLDITGKILKLKGSGAPISAIGTVLTAGSTIEYNGTAAQNVVLDGIDYSNMSVNNPAGVTVPANMNIPGTLSILNGDLELNGKVINLLSTGNLVETAGNTVKGNTGYITTVRNVNAPNSLNIAGLGAVITSSKNFGLTEVRRGHTIQTIPGGQSIRRYYVIRPDNNTALAANCVFNYDESELNSLVENQLKMLKSTNAGGLYLVGGGTVNTAQNNVTVLNINDFARHTLGPGLPTVNIVAAPEGFFNATTGRLNSKDTLRVTLRNISPPYGIVDSAKGVIDSVTLITQLLFTNAPNGTYYVVVKHRNSIETWSKAGGEIYRTDASLFYNFTTAQSQAYGNNQTIKGSKWLIYSGDSNRDEAVDISDLLLIDNDASQFLTGYLITDVNGDRFVDVSDVAIADNNAANFVGRITP